MITKIINSNLKDVLVTSIQAAQNFQSNKIENERKYDFD